MAKATTKAPRLQSARPKAPRAPKAAAAPPVVDRDAALEALEKMVRDVAAGAERVDDAKEFLIQVMNSGTPTMRLDAAKALLPYQHAKVGEVGVKEKRQQAAAEVASAGGMFAPGAPPKLVRAK